MRDEFIDVLTEEAERNPSIFLITGDLGFGVLEKFAYNFPKQYLNTGVNEQSMMSLAAGLASTGKRVFVYSIANFPTLRCLEQIRNDVCYMNNPVVVVSVGSGFSYGPAGYTHHALEDIAVMRALPNMNVLVPSDGHETKSLTRYLIKSKLPSYLRLGRNKEFQIHRDPIDVIDGHFIEIYKTGRDGNLLFTGSIGEVGLKAREELNKKGLDIGVFSCPFVSNLDITRLREFAKCGPLVVLEEHSYRGGFASSILEALSINGINCKVRIVAAQQKKLSQVGDRDFLRESNGLGVADILHAFQGI